MIGRIVLAVVFLVICIACFGGPSKVSARAMNVASPSLMVATKSQRTAYVVLDPARTQTMGSVGEYFWTGMANTQFWIDPVEDLIVIQMAQLIPSTLVPVRRELRTLTYQALTD
jgi:CubicO group peptidase (beta-lactamase class C family)